MKLAAGRWCCLASSGIGLERDVGACARNRSGEQPGCSNSAGRHIRVADHASPLPRAGREGLRLDRASATCTDPGLSTLRHPSAHRPLRVHTRMPTFPSGRIRGAGRGCEDRVRVIRVRNREPHLREFEVQGTSSRCIHGSRQYRQTSFWSSSIKAGHEPRIAAPRHLSSGRPPPTELTARLMPHGPAGAPQRPHSRRWNQLANRAGTSDRVGPTGVQWSGPGTRRPPGRMLQTRLTTLLDAADRLH